MESGPHPHQQPMQPLPRLQLPPPPSTQPHLLHHRPCLMSAAWSPRILGHHQFRDPESLEETLPFTPTNVREMLSYYDHLSEVHENLKDMSLFCP